MHSKKSAFTLVELLVVIAIISMLAALLLPTIESALRTAREICCMNNMRQSGVVLDMYMSDYGGHFVSTPATGTDADMRNSSFFVYYLAPYYNSAYYIKPWDPTHPVYYELRSFEGPMRCPTLTPWRPNGYTAVYNGTQFWALNMQQALNVFLIMQKSRFPVYSYKSFLDGRPFSVIKYPSKMVTYYHHLGRWPSATYHGLSDYWKPNNTNPPPTTHVPNYSQYWNIMQRQPAFWHHSYAPNEGAAPFLYGDAHVKQRLYLDYLDDYAEGETVWRVER